MAAPTLTRTVHIFLNVAAALLGAWTCVFVAARWLRYTLVTGPAPVERAIEAALHAQYRITIFGWVTLFQGGPLLWAAVAVATVAGIRYGLRWLAAVARRRPPAPLPAWLHAYVGLGFIFVNPLLDMIVNPIYAIGACALGLAIRRFGPPTRRADNAVMCVMVLALANVIVATTTKTPPAATIRDADPGGSYDFCQLPGKFVVFASGHRQEGREQIAELTRYDWSEPRALDDARRMAGAVNIRKSKYEPFDDNIRGGRIKRIVCDHRDLYVGVGKAQFYETRSTQGLLHLPLDENNDIAGRHAMSTRSGTLLVFDVFRRQLFSASGEGRMALERFDVDLKTGEVVNARPGSDLNSRMSSISVSNHGLSPDSNSLYLADHMFGTNVHALSWPDLNWLRSHPVNQGGNVDIVVDRSGQRLIVSGVWGFSVLDAETGQVLARRRTDFAPRAAWPIEAYDLLLVPTTFGRGVFIYRWSTLEFLRILPIGHGVRQILVDEDRRYLFVASQATKFMLDLQAVAAFANGEIR